MFETQSIPAMEWYTDEMGELMVRLNGADGQRRLRSTALNVCIPGHHSIITWLTETQPQLFVDYVAALCVQGDTTGLLNYLTKQRDVHEQASHTVYLNATVEVGSRSAASALTTDFDRWLRGR